MSDKELIKQLEEIVVDKHKEIEELKNENEKLTKEWLKSQEKRRKAIEYIEDNLYPVGNDVNGSDLPYDEAIQPLVDILKGVDKE